MRRLGGLAAILLGGVLVAAATEKKADLLLLHGKVLTMAPARPEAEALAIAGDRVLAVGSSAEISKLRGEGTRVVDLAGKTAMPGLIDGHAQALRE